MAPIWSAASSLRKYKDLVKRADPITALNMLVGTPVYHFRYRPDADSSTGDFKTEYIGVLAEDAPWAMHYGGSILNPVNAFGYSLLGIQALERRVVELEHEIARLRRQ